jgi:hypothetical protein
MDPHSIGRQDPDPGGQKRAKMKKKMQHNKYKNQCNWYKNQCNWYKNVYCVFNFI